MLIALGATHRRPLAGRARDADRRGIAGRRHSAAAGWPRQFGQPLRVQVRHHGEHARRALLRRRRDQALLHLRQDRARGAGAAAAGSRTRSSTTPASSCSARAPMWAPRASRPIPSRELAQQIGLAPEVLDPHGRGVQRGLPRGRSVRSRRSWTARARSAPRCRSTSNWAIKIEKPPFRAYPIVCGITFTFGGLKINTRAQVLSTAGKPDPRALCLGRRGGAVLSQLSRQHRTDPQRRVQPGRGARSGRPQPVEAWIAAPELGAWQSRANPLNKGPEGVPTQFVGAPLRVLQNPR